MKRVVQKCSLSLHKLIFLDVVNFEIVIGVCITETK